MARLQGTGKDPRYGKGEIFDVPMYAPVGVIGTADQGGVERELNPTYAELIEKGLAKAVKPEDDPGRSMTQIADAVVANRTSFADPVDAKLAASLDPNDAYAIVHTGDPKAKAGKVDGDVTLKPKAIQDTQEQDSLQRGSGGGLSEVEILSENADRDSEKAAS